MRKSFGSLIKSFNIKSKYFFNEVFTLIVENINLIY